MAKATPKTTFSEVKCENVHDDAYNSEFLKRIDTFKNNVRLCDVVLIAGNDGKRIPAHRVILACSCAYFSAMFTGSLRESVESEVTIKDISGEVLEILVDYCYTGSIDLRGDTIEMIMKNADLMQLDSAVDTCSNYLIRNLHPQNCIEIMLFALQMNFVTLLNASLEFIYRNFMEVSSTEGFLNLEVEHLIKIISRDDLCVASEEYVFDAVKKWLEYLRETRRKFINKLLGYVRLHLLSPEYIVDNVEPIYENVHDKTLVIEALKYHLLPNKTCLLTTATARPRTGYSRLVLLYSEAGSSVKIAEFNRMTSTLSDWFSLSMDQYNFGITAMNDQILFSGGVSAHRGHDKTVSCYDWSTKELKSLQTLTSGRYGQAMIVHNGSLYVIGDINENEQYVKTVEKLDLDSGNWVACESMLAQRAFGGIAAILNKLYVVGGHAFNGNLSSVECFSTDTGKWQQIAPMNKPRTDFGVAAVNGLLYAFGGYGCEHFFERYDPLTDKWTMCDSMMEFNGPTSCAVIGNSIYVSSNNKIREYNVVNNAWKCMNCPAVPQGRTVQLLTLPGFISRV